MRDFEEWFKNLKKSINGYDFYTDFKKVCKNIDDIKDELLILNTLIGSKNIENDFMDIISKNPKIIKVIPILLATRKNYLFAIDENGEYEYSFCINNELDIKQLCYFMEQSGLFNFLRKSVVHNLVDYVIGIEAGLDTHARKNRIGCQMETLVEKYIMMTNKTYYVQKNSKEIEKLWNIQLPLDNKYFEKKWDFIIKNNNNIYFIETNFYSSNGSKLSEITRSYELISQQLEEFENIHFIWITDGYGWQGAKNSLQKAFNNITHLYNINDLNNGFLNNLFNNENN